MKKTIKGILTNKDLMKDTFSGIGYFVFVAGISKVLMESAKQAEWYEKVSVVGMFLLLMGLAIVFWVLHVIRPIVQISWPEFGLPGIDSHAKPIPVLRMIKRFDIWVFLVLALLSIELGWYLVRVILERVGS